MTSIRVCRGRRRVADGARLEPHSTASRAEAALPEGWEGGRNDHSTAHGARWGRCWVRTRARWPGRQLAGRRKLAERVPRCMGAGKYVHVKVKLPTQRSNPKTCAVAHLRHASASNESRHLPFLPDPSTCPNFTAWARCSS